MPSLLEITVRADIGGGPEHLYQLLAHLPGRFEAHVACPDDRPYRQRFTDLLGAGRIVDVPHRAFSLAALRRLAREVRARDVALIHCHGKGAGLYGRLLAVLTGRPCVHTFHGLHVGDYGAAKRLAYLGLEALLGRATAAAVCVSQGERDQILRAGFLPRSKLHVVENGVETPPLRASEPPAGPLRLVAVNRYDVQKNPELILDIAAALKADPAMPAFRITVLGTGERLAACREAVARRGLADCVDLAGPSTAPRAAFRAAHAFLSTSRWEGMPMAVLEAMSEGLPVVATDVVGNRDVVAGEVSGLLFATENAAAGAAAIRRLADPALRARLGAAARRVVEERFSVTRMAERTADLYDAVLARR
ncbi:glycosyltransferase [Polymorphum gilvum]|uniref:Glycosyl transferase, group 1/2 family protein n=1 Tax=Polymorphum gilvum (strain LMG 25793 / CGMCC 1.9160 / SL003B-26A1) TaxID=991905 RepID=F2IW74_POLGS|nr:glycosyltransferase [Polymorphum gilvum]ADZ71459.1 Glycosyl transferase, group 1/2 family protein [Polymorphum gilvum SL003B-26A1]